MPGEIEDNEAVVNSGASTSTTAETTKEDKKKNAPWIEKYRPHKFEEIMGKICKTFNVKSNTLSHFMNSRQRRDCLETRSLRHARKHTKYHNCWTTRRWQNHNHPLSGSNPSRRAL
jgi:hypothetical protein